MKRIKQAAWLILALTAMLAFCACGVAQRPKENPDKVDIEVSNNESPVGTYTLFAIDLEDYLVENPALDMEATITIEEGGGGSMTINDQTAALTWTGEGGQITVDSGGEMKGTVANGILILDMDDFFAYLAKEGADVSGFKVLTTKEYDESGGRAAALLKYGKEYYYGYGEEGFNRDEAERYLRLAIEKGSTDAWYYIGKLYENSDVEGKYDKILEAFQTGADGGSALGFYGLGRAYEHGLGVDKDYKKAMSNYKKAVELGLVEANYGLGQLYHYGEGVDVDGLQALSYYQDAIKGKEFGLVNSAKTAISELYYKGISGVTQNYEKALSWCKEAVEAGFSGAINYLATLYDDGKAVEQDYAKAMELLKKAAALNSSSAMYNLGRAFEYGLGVETDPTSAVKWYKKALDSGNTESLTKIGLYYFGNPALNPDQTDVDPAKAAKYFKRAAKEDGSPYTFYNYGILFFYGDGVEQNQPEAYKWFAKGAKEGDALSMYMVGNYFYNGWEPAGSDLEKAAAWYKKALETDGLGEETINDINAKLAELGG